MPLQKERLVWWNGELIPESEAKLSIYDSSLMFGDMVFEMTRSFNKKQFKLREHLDRLYCSMKYLDIPPSISIEEMEEAVCETIEANEPMFDADDEHRLMIDVTRGLLGIYNGNVKGVPGGTNVIIADFPLRWTVSSLGHLFDSGINAVIPSQRTIPSRLLDPKVKNRSRVHYMMANIQTSKFSGKDNWAILLDEDGFISEGTGDNFFIVKDREVITPEGRNILRGISRDYIFELCLKYNLKCTEKNIEPYDVLSADEAFITGTPFCMLPVTSLGGSPIGDGKVGEVYNLLLACWSDEVGVNIAGQIRSYSKKDVGDGPTPYEFKSK